jgi:hypothetical protein
LQHFRISLFIARELLLLKAAPLLRPLVAGFPSRRSGFDPGSIYVGLGVVKVVLRQVFSQYFINSHFTHCSTIIIACHPGLVQWAKVWPTHQMDSVSPHPKKLKKKKNLKGLPSIVIFLSTSMQRPG